MMLLERAGIALFPIRLERVADQRLCDTFRQVRLLPRLRKLPFALLETVAMIPFIVLVHGVNGCAALDWLAAPRAPLVLEIAGKHHTRAPLQPLRPYRTVMEVQEVNGCLYTMVLPQCIPTRASIPTRCNTVRICHAPGKPALTSSKPARITWPWFLLTTL